MYMGHVLLPVSVQRFSARKPEIWHPQGLCSVMLHSTPRGKRGGGDNLLFHVMPHNPAILGKTEPISGKNIATLTLHFLLA